MWSRLKSELSIKRPNGVFIYAVVVGVLAGLASMFFSWMLHFLESFYASFSIQNPEKTDTLIEKTRFIFQHPTSAIIIVLLPAFGGLIAGLIIYIFCPDAKGTGTDEMINAFHNKEGRIEPKVPFFKALATLFTLPTGGSGGKEGPISFIGAGIGVLVANTAKAGARARRTLMLSGTAAGLGSVFKTPLGGALTAAEMVYKEDIESDALIPCFISSVTAYLVYITYAGTEPYLNVSRFTNFHTNEILFYLILGVLCFGFGYLFIEGFNKAKRFINKINIVSYMKPAIGGLLTGGIAVVFFSVSGTGEAFLHYTINGNLPDFIGGHTWVTIVISLLTIAFLKIMATTLTIGSGGSAGIFAPSLFIGAMLGAAVGVAAKFFLNHEVSIVSFMVVGMGAFYAGVANAPMAGIIMIVEMTGSYILLPPLIIVSIFTFIMSKRISMYKSQVENRFKSPAHAWDMNVDVIESIKIKDHFPEYRLLAVVSKKSSLAMVQQLAHDIHASDFIVVDDKLKYEGTVSLRTINTASIKKPEAVPITRFMDRSVPYVTPEEKLNKALQIITRHDVDKVAVVEDDIMVGYIRSKDIFEAYNEQLKFKKGN